MNRHNRQTLAKGYFVERKVRHVKTHSKLWEKQEETECILKLKDVLKGQKIQRGSAKIQDTKLHGHNPQMVSMFSRYITFLRGEEGSCLSLKLLDFSSVEETRVGASKDLKTYSSVRHLNRPNKFILFIEVAFSSNTLCEYSL